MAVAERRVIKPARAIYGSGAWALRSAPSGAGNAVLGVLAALVAMIVPLGCASPPPRGASQVAGTTTTPEPGALQPAPLQPTAVDSQYDWHALLLAPFGTLLKDSPVPLHEVLLFREATRGAADGDLKDCYAIDAAAPRLVGRATDEYLLCFEHDRLARIDASVNLAADEAAAVFTRACAVWQKTAAPPLAEGPCEGRDGAVTFSAHLTPLPDTSAAVLALTLTNAAERDAAHAPSP